MRVDYDRELFDVVGCFGLEADRVESFGEGRLREIEVFDDDFVRVGVRDDEVDPLRWIGAIEFDRAKAKELDGFVQGCVVESDFWEFGLEFS